jgi:hypothetical protein
MGDVFRCLRYKRFLAIRKTDRTTMSRPQLIAEGSRTYVDLVPNNIVRQRSLIYG